MDEWLQALQQELIEAAEWMKVVILGVSTFISEDLTTIGAGIMVGQGILNPATAILGCFLGILIGDGLLYVVGLTVGRPALKFPIVRRFLSEEKVAQGQRWFEQNGMMVVIVSRFLPGTRLPTYFAAGLMGSKARYFLLAATIATALWTPLLVGAAWFFGDQLIDFYSKLDAHPLVVIPISIITLFLAMRFMSNFANWKWRRRARSRLKRLMRWEFWPIAVIYTPVLLYNLWSALRFRRLTLPMACNPGIKHSGIIGESKAQILSDLSCDAFTARHLLLPGSVDLDERLERVESWMREHGESFPLILKPDVGQRGAGVKVIRSAGDLDDYLTRVPIDVVVQQYAPGPYEFGVSYMRYPDEDKGRIFSITGKSFPRVVGDGSSTIEELILHLPAAMGRIHIFLKRFESRLAEVPAVGETIELVHSGNHCQGTIFLDNAYLNTPMLESRIDAIAQAMPGFYIGRFDVRVEDLEAFRNGVAFKIIELNGATSEPSHIYDPQYSIWYAWRHLIRQWKAIWEIGAINRKRGTRHSTLPQLLKDLWHFHRLSRHHLSAD